MLIYDEPPLPETRPAEARPAEPLKETSGRVSIAELIQMLWRHRIAILVAGAIGGALALGFGEISSPRYTATAQIYIDPRDVRLVNRELTSAGQDAASYLSIVESQTKVITSRSVLDRVVAIAKLDQDPEFAGGADGTLGTMLVNLGLRTPLPPHKASVSVVLETLERRITIRRAERTFIVDISVWAGSAEKAAVIANAITEAYLEEDSDSRTGVARRATASLSARLEELRERVREAENRVEQYKSKNNLVGTRETLVSDQQLMEANQSLSAARAKTAQARARYDQMRSAPKTGSIDGAMSEALTSQTMATLRGQHAEIRRRQAELQNTLGPLHPSVKSMESQVRDIARLIQIEISRFVESARNDLESARANEASLEASLENLKRRTVEGGQAAVQLRELERQVDASRGVYEAFLVRARETGEQERLSATNARVISEASPPRYRSFPPRLSLLALVGLFLGLAAGVGFAFLREWLRETLISSPPAAPSVQRELVMPPPRRETISPRTVAPLRSPLEAAQQEIIRWAREPKGGYPKAPVHS